MKDKLEPNMYVRTKKGEIAKVISNDSYWINIDKFKKDGMTLRMIRKIDISKTSHNIIDLIEEGDYVNGSEVLNFENKYIKENDEFVRNGIVTENCYLENTDSWIIEKDIKSIVTKEQFYSMEYRLGGKDE